jgi:hypothetical protein
MHVDMNIQSLDVQEYNDKNVDEHLKDEESLEEDHIEGGESVGYFFKK